MRLRLLLVVPIFAFAIGARPEVPRSTPSAAASSTARSTAAPEDPAVTKAARTLFEQVIAQKVDRTRLTAKLNNVMTDSTIATASGQLRSLGIPTWTYLSSVSTAAGRVFVYKLAYPAVTLYVAYGETGGKTSLFFISPRSPLAK